MKSKIKLICYNSTWIIYLLFTCQAFGQTQSAVNNIPQRTKAKPHTNGLSHFHTFATHSPITQGHLNWSYTPVPSMLRAEIERDSSLSATLYGNALTIGLGDYIAVGSRLTTLLPSSEYESGKTKVSSKYWNLTLNSTLYKNESVAVGFIYSRSDENSNITQIKKDADSNRTVGESWNSVTITHEYAFASIVKLTDASFINLNYISTIFVNTDEVFSKYFSRKSSFAIESGYRFTPVLQFNLGYLRMHSLRRLSDLLEREFANISFANNNEFLTDPEGYTENLLKKSSDNAYENLISTSMNIDFKNSFISTLQLGVKYSLEYKNSIFGFGMRF